MNRLLVVLPWALLATACVPASYPWQRASLGYPRGPYGAGVRVVASDSPVGRWDNVMLLPAGTPLQVLRTDGRTAIGRMDGADSATLRLQATSGPIAIASADVMRIDRVAPGVARNVGKGAAVGAGAVGVLGLIAGRVPPARLFAAGAIVGGYHNAELAAMAGPTTVYLAPWGAAGVGPAPSPPARQGSGSRE